MFVVCFKHCKHTKFHVVFVENKNCLPFSVSQIFIFLLCQISFKKPNLPLKVKSLILDQPYVYNKAPARYEFNPEVAFAFSPKHIVGIHN